jgi:FAD:protein FMN transferase
MSRSFFSVKETFHDQFMAMNTRFDAVFTGIEPFEAEDLFFRIKTEILRIERMLNHFDEDSPVSEINRKAFNGPLEVNPELWEVLKRCKYHFEKTSGAFDITIFKLLNCWKEYLAENRTPCLLEIQELQSSIGMDKVVLNEKNKTIYFTSPGIELDFGGWGKGYALERIRLLLEQSMLENGFISFGDSSILAIGHHPHGDHWKVGVRNMFKPTENVLVYEMLDSALSTSGTSSYNELKGPVIYGKTISPFTGFPIEGYQSISVHCQSPEVAEVLSTSLLVADEKQKEKIKKNYQILSTHWVTYDENHLSQVVKIC